MHAQAGHRRTWGKPYLLVSDGVGDGALAFFNCDGMARPEQTSPPVLQAWLDGRR